MDIQSLRPSPADGKRLGFTSYLAGGYWSIVGREWLPGLEVCFWGF